jgi:hypothetical protein
VVVAAGVTVTDAPLVTGPTLLLMLPVPPEKTAVRVVELPVVIVAAAAVKLLITIGPTIRFAVPLTPFCAAVIVAVPLPFALATPARSPLLNDATAVFDEVQFTEVVKSFVEPLL